MQWFLHLLNDAVVSCIDYVMSNDKNELEAILDEEVVI